MQVNVSTAEILCASRFTYLVFTVSVVITNQQPHVACPNISLSFRNILFNGQKSAPVRNAGTVQRCFRDHGNRLKFLNLNLHPFLTQSTPRYPAQQPKQAPLLRMLSTIGLDCMRELEPVKNCLIYCEAWVDYVCICIYTHIPTQCSFSEIVSSWQM